MKTTIIEEPSDEIFGPRDPEMEKKWGPIRYGKGTFLIPASQADHDYIARIKEEMERPKKLAEEKEREQRFNVMVEDLRQADITKMLTTDALLIEFMDTPYHDIVGYKPGFKEIYDNQNTRLLKGVIVNYIEALEHAMHLAYMARMAIQELKNENLV